MESHTSTLFKEGKYLVASEPVRALQTPQVNHQGRILCGTSKRYSLFIIRNQHKPTLGFALCEGKYLVASEPVCALQVDGLGRDGRVHEEEDGEKVLPGQEVVLGELVPRRSSSRRSLGKAGRGHKRTARRQCKEDRCRIIMIITERQNRISRHVCGGSQVVSHNSCLRSRRKVVRSLPLSRNRWEAIHGAFKPYGACSCRLRHFKAVQLSPSTHQCPRVPRRKAVMPGILRTSNPCLPTWR